MNLKTSILISHFNETQQITYNCSYCNKVKRQLVSIKKLQSLNRLFENKNAQCQCKSRANKSKNVYGKE